MEAFVRPFFSLVYLSVACGLSLLLSGCSLSKTSVPTTDTGLAIRGMVRGGQQPIVGANVYLFAANAGVFTPNANGYGNASVSLLTSVPGSTTLDTSGGATNGDYYVTTDSNGNFSITGVRPERAEGAGADRGSGAAGGYGLLTGAVALRRLRAGVYGTGAGRSGAGEVR